MTTYTAYNGIVQSYMTYSGENSTTRAKKMYLKQIKERLQNQNIIFEQLFSSGKKKVLDEIIYMTSGCGVWKMGSDTLARRAKVSQSTVFNAVRALKQTGLFVVGRLADDNAGKYIFVNKLHPNFEDIMKEVFFLPQVTIKELSKVLFKGLQNAKPLDTVSLEGQKQGPNYINLNNKHTINNYIYPLNKNTLAVIKKEIEDQQPKTASEQRKLLLTYTDNEYQRLFFDFIQSMPYPAIVRENAYKLALRVGSNADKERFFAAKEVIHHISMDIEYNHFDNVVAVFTTALSNRLEYPSIPPVKLTDQHVRRTKKGVFYNWLED